MGFHFPSQLSSSLHPINWYSNISFSFPRGKRAYSSNEAIIGSFWDRFIKELDEPSLFTSETQSYHYNVFQLLSNRDGADLRDLQVKIENMTMTYDRESLYKTAPYLLSQLTSGDSPTAREYLKGRPLENEDLEVIFSLKGDYTLEAICIYVLGLVFSCAKESPVVKLSTLVDQLDTAVRVQSNIEGSHKGVLKKEGADEDFIPLLGGDNIKIKGPRFAIGRCLAMFLMERGLIAVSTDVNFSEILGKKGYFPKTCYAMCNFDFSILPMKLNLPMVYPPMTWVFDESKMGPRNDGYITLSDITGGYLCGSTAEMFNRFKVLTTRNLDYFNIYFKIDTFVEVYKIMNGLQSQPFRVNRKLLRFINENRSSLEKVGLLMPGKLANINMVTACSRLREYYFKDEEGLKGACKLDYLLAEFQKRVQRARYEDFVIKLASAYENYTFYLPAFMDFRGRIYRAGVLHFHERDLSKSLIQFGGSHYDKIMDPALPYNKKMMNLHTVRDHLYSAAAFKYKKFSTNDDAAEWYKSVKSKICGDPNSLILLAAKASDPFQFMAKALTIEPRDIIEWGNHPVTQDASASAYQIMSYLLLNTDMAMLTNLIPTEDGYIQDMYLSLRKELLLFLEDHFEGSMMVIIKEFMTRKLVKSIFMPLIYGKTVISISNDIRLAFGSYLGAKDCIGLSLKCNEFFSKKFPDIVNLMKLVSKIAWFCSAVNKPVLSNTDYYLTLQDYTCSITENIQVYNRITKKRHRVTLRIPTTKRDKRKSQVSTFANFIHQKDAFITMNVIKELRKEGAPVYTVHDNFVSTFPFAKGIPKIYTDIFINLGSPIQFINKFIVTNLAPYDIKYFYESKEKPPFLNEIASIDKVLSLLSGEIEEPIHWIKNPIPLDHLKIFLLLNIPEEMTPNERKKWDSKIEEILQLYDCYVTNVCGINSHDVVTAGIRHSEKWNRFKKQIKKWDTFNYNYSLHY